MTMRRRWFGRERRSPTPGPHSPVPAWLAVGLCGIVSSLVGLGATSDPSGAATRVTRVPVAPVALPDPGDVITPGMDVPDPFITEVAGVYFLFASQARFFGANIPVMVSASLTNWRPGTLDAMPRLPSWAAPGFTWSPDIRRLDGRYVMWFNAALAGRGFGQTKCIGVATASSVVGPFRSRAMAPMVCQLDHFGSIDPRTFMDPKGRLWLLWKSDDNAQMSASTRTTIYIQRLSPDGLHLSGRPVALMTPDRPWEGQIVESPDMVFAGGRYWLFFSGNWFNQPAYAIGVAQCVGPTGPCEPSAGPWLASNAQGPGPGEESLFYDGSRWWMLYAPFAVDYQASTPRPAALARLSFGPNGPAVVAPGTAAWEKGTPAVAIKHEPACTDPFRGGCPAPGHPTMMH